MKVYLVMEELPDYPKMLFPHAVYTDKALAEELANGMNMKNVGIEYTVEETDTDPDYSFMYNRNKCECCNGTGDRQ